MTTVLITGAAGLLGGKLATHIIENDYNRVVGIDDLSGGLPENLFWTKDPHRFEQIQLGDMSGKSDQFEQLVKETQPEVIFHFAAYAAECLSPFIRKFNYKNNLIATADVINAAIKYGVRRVVFTSSMAVYGKNVPPFHEKLPRQPIDPYGVAKAACEMDLEIAKEQHGLEIVILRPHNVYGPFQNIFDPYRNVIGIFMYKTLVGDPITVYGDGKQTRAFSYIDDTLEPMYKAAHLLDVDGEIINIGGIRESSILDVADIVRETARNKGLTVPDIKFLPPRHEVRHAYSTYQKSVYALGYEHITDIEVGISKMWDWVLEITKDRPLERQIWNRYELDKGLYPYWKPEALQDGYWKDSND